MEYYHYLVVKACMVYKSERAYQIAVGGNKSKSKSNSTFSIGQR